MKLAASFLVAALAVVCLTASPAAAAEWSECLTIPDVGPVCVELFAFEANLSLVMDITVDGETVLSESVSAGQVCVSVDTLLDVLEAVCDPCIPIIHAIEKVEKDVGASILSLCADLSDVDFTRTHVSGEVELVANILCWEGHCVYKGTGGPWSFDIPFGSTSSGASSGGSSGHHSTGGSSTGGSSTGNYTSGYSTGGSSGGGSSGGGSSGGRSSGGGSSGGGSSGGGSSGGSSGYSSGGSSGYSSGDAVPMKIAH